MNQAVCHRRLPLELGHGNTCRAAKAHKVPLHISSGDPQGEINTSTGNTPDQKQQQHLETLNELVLLYSNTLTYHTYQSIMIFTFPPKLFISHKF